MRWRALVALGALACVTHAARADTRSVSYSTWIVSGDRVTLRYVLPVAEAERLSGSDVPVLTVSKLGDYVLSHVAVRASDHDCPAIDQGYDLGRIDPLQVGAGLYGFEIIFQCSSTPAAVTLVNRGLFDRVPTHVDFARVETDAGSSEQLFTAARERLTVSQSGATQAASASRYARLGFLHILRSADSLCLLLAALLLVRRKHDLGYLLGALAAGYVPSVLAQATGLILPRARFTDAFVGFLITLLAASLIVRATRPRESTAVAIGWPVLLAILALIAALMHAQQPALLLSGAALISGAVLSTLIGSQPQRGIAAYAWLLPASLFGFLDGLALPTLLAPLHLAQEAQVRMVAGYDAGAMLAATLVLGLLAGGFAVLRARQLAPPYALLHDATAACLGALGTFWLISRLH
jgi:hypothetical protein